MSAIRSFADSKRTSTQVRKGPLPDIAARSITYRDGLAIGTASDRTTFGRCKKIDLRAVRNDTCRIDRAVTAVVMRLDLIEPNGVGDALVLIECPRVVPQFREIDEAIAVALEVSEIGGVEAHERREQPHVRF